MADLNELFDRLVPADSGDFSAAPIPPTTHRLGKDAQGNPALLISSSNMKMGERIPSIRLEHLDVRPGSKCKITNPDGAIEEGVFTIIHCIDADGALIRYFIKIIEPIIQILGPAPTQSCVHKVISNLVELFRSLSKPPLKSIQGLWAELFLIRYAHNPISMIEAWHIAPEEKYDFSEGKRRIEVKSSGCRERIHHFSMEQLCPPNGCTVIVASLFADKVGGGTSINTLANEISQLFINSPELQLGLERVIMMTLGNAWGKGANECFDLELAKNSILFFNCDSIPKLEEPIPFGVSDVHFKSDLGRSEAMTKDQLLTAGGIFASAMSN